MVEDKIKNLVETNPDVIAAIEKEEITEEEHVAVLKVRFLLCDGTILWIREVMVRNEVMAYSYYWLRPDQTVIIGWDNAPHHREVSSFPHHKHRGDKVEPSNETDLNGVIKFIRKFLA